MTVITSYLYEQRRTAVITDTGVNNTMTMFYTPNLKVYRGLSNRIRIEFKNRDQKRVNMSKKTANIVVIDKENSTSYIERSLEMVDPIRGIMLANITEGDLLNLDAKLYSYAIKVTDEEDNILPAYSDDNLNANGVLEIVEGVYPTFNESSEETFSGSDTGSRITIKPYINRNTANHTAQVFFSEAFTGNLKVQGSINPANSLEDSDFTDITTQTHTNQTDNAFFNFTGVYNVVRFVRTTTSGTLNKVLYRP